MRNFQVTHEINKGIASLYNDILLDTMFLFVIERRKSKEWQHNYEEPVVPVILASDLEEDCFSRKEVVLEPGPWKAFSFPMAM